MFSPVQLPQLKKNQKCEEWTLLFNTTPLFPLKPWSNCFWLDEENHVLQMERNLTCFQSWCKIEFYLREWITEALQAYENESIWVESVCANTLPGTFTLEQLDSRTKLVHICSFSGIKNLTMFIQMSGFSPSLIIYEEESFVYISRFVYFIIIIFYNTHLLGFSGLAICTVN